MKRHRIIHMAMFLGAASTLVPLLARTATAQDFIRGDFDGNGVLEPVVDYVWAIGLWDFSAMTWPAPCPDAADYDDDGDVDYNDLEDLFYNWWAFDNNWAAPPAPGGLVCGSDPTPDPLGCPITSCVPVPAPVDAAYVLSVGGIVGDVLDEIAPAVILNTSAHITGFSFGLCHDPGFLELVAIEDGADLPLGWPTGASHFVRIDDSGTGWAVGYIHEDFGMSTLPAGSYEMYRPRYRLLSPGNSTLDFCELQDLYITNRVTRATFDAVTPQLISSAVSVTLPPMPHDACASPEPLTLGNHYFTNQGATSDGSDLSGSCNFSGSGLVHHDLWFQHVAECTGTVDLTVASDLFAPRISVYRDVSCIPLASDVLACAEAVSSPAPGEAMVSFDVVQGDTYRIQVGGADASNPGGIGSLTMSCDPDASFQQYLKLLPDPSGPGARFGHRVVLAGDRMAVSAPRDPEFGAEAGAVFVYTRAGATWQLEQKITANLAGADQRFGIEIAFDGDTLAVANDPGGGIERVEIYQRQGSTWFIAWEFTSPAGSNDETFGESMDIEGDVLAIGSQSSTQTVWICRRFGGVWQFDVPLTTSDPLSAQFGWDVAIDNDVILVSGVTSNVLVGRAYVFRFDGVTWNEETILDATDGEFLDVFGHAVDVRGNLALIGASGDDDGCLSGFACEFGTAYLFEYDGVSWNLLVTLQRANPIEFDNFGSAVKILPGRELLIGGFGATGEGAASLFVPSGGTWIEQQIIQAQDSDPVDAFGLSIDGTATELVFGAHLDDEAFIDGGAAYVFTRPTFVIESDFVRGDCNQDGMNNIADTIFLLSVLFPSTNPPTVGCDDACDGNDDGGLDIADAVSLLGALFGTPTTPLPPPSVCGPDASSDLIGCASPGPSCP